MELPELPEVGCDWQDGAEARIREFARHKNTTISEAEVMLVCELGQRENQLRDALEETEHVFSLLSEMYRSAHPNSRDHPTMFPVWRRVEKFMEERNS